MNFITKIFFPLMLLIIVLLAGCTGMTWEQGLEILDDYEQESAYLKRELILSEQKADSNFRLLGNEQAKINRCSNDIAETKSCLDILYNEESDTSLIFFGLESTPRKKDTTYLTCCTGYRERFKLRRDDFDVLQSIFDQITIDNNKLNSRLHNLKAENDSLIKLIELNGNILSNCKNNLYNLVNGNKEMLSEFREEFSKIEKLIAGKKGSRNERNELLSQIAANRFVCLPEFRERFEAMKKGEGQ